MFDLEAIKTKVLNSPESMGLVAGLLVMLIINGWFCHLRKKRKRDRIIAIERDHIIKAKLIKTIDSYDKDNNRTRSGRYEYSVDGKIKHKTVNCAAYELTLYYVDSPHKAFSIYDNYESGCGFAVIMGVLACVLTMYFIGRFYYLFD